MKTLILKESLNGLVTNVIDTQCSYNRYMSEGHRNEDFVKYQQLLVSQNELIDNIANSYCKTLTEPKGKIVTITENGKYDSNFGRMNKFIEFNGRKYKLMFDLRNGGCDITAMVMNSDGEFKHLLGKNDLYPYTPTASYVSSGTEKEREAKKAIECLESLIKQIHK